MSPLRPGASDFSRPPERTASELAAASQATLADYTARAESFWAGTRDHDVSQNIDALLGAIEGTPPFRILDFGCGPGRDLAAFAARGHQPTGLDGCARFAEMARTHANAPVWQQDFLALDLPSQAFDGVFANASLFHVPGQELARVLGALRATLVPGGVLFASNPLGDGREGFSGARYAVYHRPEAWQRAVAAAGFELIEAYYRPPGLPREQQNWFATVWRV